MISVPGAVIAAISATRTTIQRQDLRIVLPRITPSMFNPTRMTGIINASEKKKINLTMKEI